jgi:hypothetical protein
MNDLLPKVDLYRISESARQDLAELVRDVVRDVVRQELKEHSSKRFSAGGMGADSAAAYLGVGRSTFYVLLEKHPELKRASYKVG